MCGLFGFSGHQPVDVTKIRWLAVENQSRGNHSTGIFVCKRNKDKTKELFKEARSASMFVQTFDFNQRVAGSYIVQGHTRHATVGSITKENAHPFHFKEAADVVGAHNGFVLSSFKNESQAARLGFDSEFDVDSMLIFAALAKHADFNILPTIEGGIACSFQMLDKYPDTVFLYQSSGRSLHIGLSPEGVYYSSEADPLKFIGCRNVTQVPSNSLVVLLNGAIVDIAPMQKPEIIVPLNGKRDTFHTALSDKDKEKIGVKVYENKFASQQSPLFSNYNGGCGVSTGSYPKKQSKTANLDTQRQYQDELNLLMRDVSVLVNAVVDEPIQFAKTISISADEINSCICVLKLTSSPKGMALPGWAVYSESDIKIAGITALNGVTALRFPPEACGKNHKLLITCPIELKDHPKLFSINVDPQTSRVMEVALELPFPQKEFFQATGNSGTIINNARKKILGLADAGSSLYADRIEQVGSIPDTSKTNKGSLSEKTEQVRVRDEGESDDGDEGRKTGATNFTGSKSGIHTKRDLVNNTNSNVSSTLKTKSKILPCYNLVNMRALIDNENKTFRLKSQVLKLLQSKEYNETLAVWRGAVGNELNIRQILHDAAIIKLNDINVHEQSWSLSYYAWKLAVYSTDTYRMRELTDDDTKLMYRALGEVLNNARINGGDLPINEDDVKKKENTIVDGGIGGFKLSPSFYAPLIEYLTSITTDVYFDLMYTEEKKTALLKVMATRTATIDTQITGMHRVLDFVVKHATLDDLLVNISVNRVLKNLRAEKQLIESFKEVLSK